MDYATGIQQGADAFATRWNSVQNLMNRIKTANDPTELQKLQTEMSIEMQKFESVKKMIDDMLGQLKKTAEPARPTQ